jgi:protein involved in polysaccharide export with SLBB domain
MNPLYNPALSKLIRAFFVATLFFFIGSPAAQAPAIPNASFYNPITSNVLADRETQGELAVDPSVYLLGPGDVIEVRCSKTPWVRHFGTVDESGVLSYPEFGIINVGKKILIDSKRDITSIVKRNCIGGDISVSLSSPKKVEVILTGEALNAGSYRLEGTMRVLDAVKMALKDPSSLTSAINLRQVNVAIQGSSYSYDIAKFIATGNSAANPYLYPGSIIFVAPATKWVTVSGAVSGALPAAIPFRENETIGDILSFFKFAVDADSSNILLLRKDHVPTKYTFSRIAAFPVENLDHIVVGLQKPRQLPLQVSISGEIRNPGVYPIIPGTTTAQELITLAGNITERGDNSRAYIRRKDPLPAISTKITQGLASVRPETNLSVRQMMSSGDYRIIPLENAASAHLENGDEIIIPEISRSIYVSGYVHSPGAYPYREGENLSYYIREAGGWAGNSDKINTKVLAVYGDFWAVKESSIRAGDIILVPEKMQEKKLPVWDFALRSVYYVALAVLVVIDINDKLHFFGSN